MALHSYWLNHRVESFLLICYSSWNKSLSSSKDSKENYLTFKKILSVFFFSIKAHRVKKKKKQPPPNIALDPNWLSRCTSKFWFLLVCSLTWRTCDYLMASTWPFRLSHGPELVVDLGQDIPGCWDPHSKRIGRWEQRDTSVESRVGRCVCICLISTCIAILKRENNFLILKITELNLREI